MDSRQAALKCLIQILENNIFADEAFNSIAEKTTNPSELKNIVSGSVKFKLTLDYFINEVSSKKINRLSSDVRNILRLGIYELEFMQRPEYAVVNSYVELCRKTDKKSVNYVNAVLRNFLRRKESILPDGKNLGQVKFLSIVYSHPEWMIKKWIDFYGREETEKICKYNNQPPTTTLRINSLKIKEDEFKKLLNNENIKFSESELNHECFKLPQTGNIKKISGYKEGYWVIQSESSALVSKILNPEPGDKVLDFCAAPGVKTTQIAAIMQNKGEITAVDISNERLKKIEENCIRLGISIVKTIQADAVNKKFNQKFDKILVDAPCSNTGVLGARADARWRKKTDDIKELSDLQIKILKNASQQLKTGGVLVYSTCSIEPEENSNLINEFLKQHNNFRLEKILSYKDFNDKNMPGALQLLQSKHNLDGFYLAKIKKLYKNRE